MRAGSATFEFIRQDRLPHILCEGCGDGTIINALLEAIVELGLDMEKVVFVSGIGCSSRIPGYLQFDSLHTTHGRPIAFATGLKLANPELNVIVITGDGDMSSIGGNHFLHGCRRNTDLTVICVNNFNYGMTGGQASPTTPIGFKTTTTTKGALEAPLDISRVAVAAGANYVSRWTTVAPIQIKESIKKALENEGFNLIEVIAQCPTAFGRRNKLKTSLAMLDWIKKNTIPFFKAEKMDEKDPDLIGKIIVGEFIDRKKPGLLKTLGLIKEEEKKEEDKKEKEKVEKKEIPPEEKERIEKAKKKIMDAVIKLSSPKVRMMIEAGEEAAKIEEQIFKKEGDKK